MVRHCEAASENPGVTLPVIVNEAPLSNNIALAKVTAEDVILPIIVADADPETIIVGKNAALVTAPITPPEFAVNVTPLLR